jgi:hypothetical protein
MADVAAFESLVVTTLLRPAAGSARVAGLDA